MSSTLTALTAATSWGSSDLFLATVGGNSRKIAASSFFTMSSDILTRSNTAIAITPVLDLAQTWNAAVVHKALRLTITDTSSSSGSKAFEIIQPFSSAKYAVWLGTSTGGSPLAYIGADGMVAGGNFTTVDGTTAGFGQSVLTGYATKDTGTYGWSSTSSWQGSIDLELRREAAGALSLRSAAIPHALRIYHTFTDTSNYQRLTLSTGSTQVALTAETAGTGNDNIDVLLSPAGTGLVDCAGPVRIQNNVSIPAGGATTVRAILSSSALGVYVGSGAPTVSAAQGSIYLRSDGSSSSTRLYVNSTGSTTWVNVTTAS